MFIWEATPSEPGIADEPLHAILTQRSGPKVIILDEELNVAFFERGALEEPAARLPQGMESAVRRAIAAWQREGDCDERVTALDADTVMRVSRMTGARGTFIAVLIEEGRRADQRDNA